MTITHEIERIISEHIENAKVLVHNTNNDSEHFEAVVISEAFNDKTLLQQHQAVMRPLKEAFKERVHALALKTFSLKKWNETKDQYPHIENKLKEKYS
jgi:stress-induced morphogen